MEAVGVTILYIMGGLLAVGLAIGAVIAAFAGAAYLFLWAVDKGPKGVAVYVGCWVLLFPIMLVISIGVGIWLTVFSKD